VFHEGGEDSLERYKQMAHGERHLSSNMLGKCIVLQTNRIGNAFQSNMLEYAWKSLSNPNMLEMLKNSQAYLIGHA
jgi:hypothetical protein